jgi:hypothetical protein
VAGIGPGGANVLSVEEPTTISLDQYAAMIGAITYPSDASIIYLKVTGASGDECSAADSVSDSSDTPVIELITCTACFDHTDAM